MGQPGLRINCAGLVYFAHTGPIKPQIYRMSLPVDLCTSAKLGLDWLEFAQVFPERLLFLTCTTSHYNMR